LQPNRDAKDGSRIAGHRSQVCEVLAGTGISRRGENWKPGSGRKTSRATVDDITVGAYYSDINMNTNTTPSPAKSAQAVGLRYVIDERPGIRRERCGQGFRYRSAEGRIIRDRHTLQRISSLVIPPAWHDVWICPLDHGHLQATGRDERERKQHLYHPRWREIRDQTKFDRVMDFARALPGVRKQLRSDLKREGLCREKVLATVVRLLEVSLIRVGNEEYARDNKSYGLTTMKNRHATVRGAKIKFQFRGKSGKEHVVEVEDRRVAKIVRACQDLPGQELFQCVDDEGQKHHVGSGDVNDYLREITGQDFTAKDFRTWAGTIFTASELRRLGPVDSETGLKENVVAAVKATAQSLGNTPAVCRKSYIHPAIIEAYLDGSLIPRLDEWKGKRGSNSSGGFLQDEAAVLQFLKRAINGRKRLVRPAG
jgi:DNA topoisomerase-1